MEKPSPDFSDEGRNFQQLTLLFLTTAAGAAAFLAFGIGVFRRRRLGRRRSDYRGQAENQ